MKLRALSFADRMLAWHRRHGRHHLPWQQLAKADEDKDIYAVWLSEIMLQQTQVATVLAYYQRFKSRYETVQALAAADWQDVSGLWAGLGYYARARNLHAGAKQLVAIIEQTGDFPKTLEQWLTIKGVGRSTAGAIMAMGVGGFGVICDGNVKRVLTRWAGIDGDISKTATDRALWSLATQLTPADDSGRYAQAMMDVGATICTRTRPRCLDCPVQVDCVAYAEGNPTAYPVKAKKAPKPDHYSHVLMINHQDKTLWLRRPDSGIWGGLWCLPLWSQGVDDPFGDQMVVQFLQDHQYLPQTTEQYKPMISGIKHTLTHFHWHLTPCVVVLNDAQVAQLNQILQAVCAQYLWQHSSAATAIPSAMAKLLRQTHPHQE